MDELLRQSHSEREAWQAMSDEERADLRGKYTWWKAEDFFAGARALHEALVAEGGDMSKCQVRQYDGIRKEEKGPRRVIWTVAVNESGEEVAAFDITFNCPPWCD